MRNSFRSELHGDGRMAPAIDGADPGADQSVGLLARARIPHPRLRAHGLVSSDEPIPLPAGEPNSQHLRDARPACRSVIVARAWHDDGFTAGVMEVANELGWRVTLLDRHGGHLWYLPRRIDGAITIIDEQGCNHALIPVLNRQQAPIVNGVQAHPPGLEVPVARVLPDHVMIGRLAARHLAEAGHRHLAFYAWSSNEVGVLRREGFTEEAKRLGRDVLPFPMHDLSDLGWLRDFLEAAPTPNLPSCCAMPCTRSAGWCPSM